LWCEVSGNTEASPRPTTTYALESTYGSSQFDWQSVLGQAAAFHTPSSTDYAFFRMGYPNYGIIFRS
jgi:hypothetical protein